MSQKVREACRKWGLEVIEMPASSRQTCFSHTCAACESEDDNPSAYKVRLRIFFFFFKPKCRCLFFAQI